MTTIATANPRLSLVVDVTDLTDEQRRAFTAEVTNLLEEYIDYDYSEPVVLGWTSSALEEALTRLDRESGWVQAKTIRQALQNGGSITRAEVYELGQYEQDRMLRGFTRPVHRIVAQMRAAGEIPANAADLLEPTYNTGPQADGFRVPAQLAALLDEDS